ncbi:MAG: hypothetical protein NTX82_03445 [Candidatus Parcubacteria bacterium]|nr:hypothetical protein [Candidatus Parcubacteria bacterium]
MKIQFEYNLSKDILNFQIAAKSLGHGGKPSRQHFIYQQTYGEQLEDGLVQEFIKNYLDINKIDPQTRLAKFQAEWDLVAERFFQRATEIFQITLPLEKVTAYLTVNDRCSYSLKENYFFVSLANFQPKKTAMHELWHFYTWYAFGEGFNRKLNLKQYFDIKESLTEILNQEFLNLMEGADIGYPEHGSLRSIVRNFWHKSKDIYQLVDNLADQPGSRFKQGL